MAGVKGKSGGPRKNAGGARPGAGRKKKAKPPHDSATVSPSVGLEKFSDSTAASDDQKEDDTLKLLQNIAFGRVDASNVQVRAAIAAVQYTHTKRGDGGKKDDQAKKAKQVAKRFATSAPPKLVASGGKKV